MDFSNSSQTDQAKSSNLGNMKTFQNAHNVMLFFAIIFLLIGFIWLICLSGVQTGSSTTSGFGSLVLSSEDSTGNTNSTYEVLAEFFIVLFLCIGVAMLTFVLTTKKDANKLIAAGQNYAALIVNGNKNVSEADIKGAEKADIQNMISNLGLPSNTLSVGLTTIKSGAIQGMNQMNRGMDYTTNQMEYSTNQGMDYTSRGYNQGMDYANRGYNQGMDYANRGMNYMMSSNRNNKSTNNGDNSKNKNPDNNDDNPDNNN
jgi:hypothetical protein